MCVWGGGGEGAGGGLGEVGVLCLQEPEYFRSSQTTENVLNHKSQTLNFTKSQITGNWIWPSLATNYRLRLANRA